MQWLSQVEMSNRGNQKGLIMKNEGNGTTELLAFVWMDQDRHYFITNTSSLTDGVPFV